MSRSAKVLNFEINIDWLGWTAYSRKLYVFGNVSASERYEKVRVSSSLTNFS